MVALIQERSAVRVARIDLVKTCVAVALPSAAALVTDAPRLLAGLF